MEAHPPERTHAELTAYTAGDAERGARLLPVIYDELRRLAGHMLVSERSGHTLQPTALIHEAYLRLLADRQASDAEVTHFKALAAQAMRRVLMDHGRGKKRQKRGGDQVQVTLTGLAAEANAPSIVGTIALHQALERLSGEHPRMARVVAYRFFGGLTVAEVAEVLDVHVSTVADDWAFARAWLHRELTAHDGIAG